MPDRPKDIGEGDHVNKAPRQDGTPITSLNDPLRVWGPCEDSVLGLMPQEMFLGALKRHTHPSLGPGHSKGQFRNRRNTLWAQYRNT